MIDDTGQGGFGMIEMLVVLAILGVLFSIALPGFRPHQMDDPAVLAQHVLSLTQATRLAAIKSNQARSVNISMRSRTIQSDTSADHIHVSDRLGFTVTYGQDDHATEDEAKISFFPGGGSTGGKIVFDRPGKTATVMVNWLTGAVSMEEQRLPQ